MEESQGTKKSGIKPIYFTHLFLNLNIIITIRKCTSQDSKALTDLARSTFYDTFTGTCTEGDMQQFLDQYYSLPRIKAELEDASEQVYFAEDNGQPVGYIRFMESAVPFPMSPNSRSLELNRLYIVKAYQGKGIAATLMDFYMDYAKTQAYGLLWLGVWEHNYRAKAFYRKYGFGFTGERHPFPIGDTPQTDEWWSRLC